MTFCGTHSVQNKHQNICKLTRTHNANVKVSLKMNNLAARKIM